MKDNKLESTFKNKADQLKVEVRPKLWDKLEKRMDDHYDSTVSPPEIKVPWLRYAAALMLLLGAGLMLSKVNQGTGTSVRVAKHFVIEEITNSVEEDLIYEEMIEFSNKYYHTLINPGAKTKTPL